MFGLKLPKQDVVYDEVVTHLWRGCLALKVGKRGEAHVNDDDDDDSNGTRASFLPGRARAIYPFKFHLCLKGCGGQAQAQEAQRRRTTSMHI